MNSYIGISPPLLPLFSYIKITSRFSHKMHFLYLHYVICEQRFNYLEVFKKIHYMAQKYIKKLDLKFFSIYLFFHISVSISGWMSVVNLLKILAYYLLRNCLSD